MDLFLFITVVLAGGIGSVIAVKRMRNPFRSDFQILPEQTERVIAHIDRATSTLPNLAGHEFPAERTRLGDLQITHSASGYWCVLVGTRSVRYSPGTRGLYSAVATADLDEQIAAIDRWLQHLSTQVGILTRRRRWWWDS